MPSESVLNFDTFFGKRRMGTMWDYSCLADGVQGNGFVGTLLNLDRCYLPLVEIVVHSALFVLLTAQAVRSKFWIREEPQEEELGVMHRKVKWICVGVFSVCVIRLGGLFWEGWPSIQGVVLHGSQTLAWLMVCISLQREEVQERAIFHKFLKPWWIVSLILTAFAVSADFVKESLFDEILDSVLFISSLTLVVILYLNKYVYRAGSDGEGDTVKTPLLDESLEKSNEIVIQPPRRSAYSQAGVLSVLTLSWLNPLVATGNKRPLIISDVPLLDPADGAVRNFRAFQECWEKNSTTGSPSSLTWVVFKVFWQPFVASMLLTFVYSTAMFVGPVIQNLLITFMQEEHREFTTGATFVLVLFSGKVVEVLSVHQFGFRSRKLGLLMWAAVGQALYEKSLRLSLKARQGRSVGEITNIFSADVQRLLQISYFAQQGLALPLQLVIAVLILFQVVGVAMVSGLAVLVIVMVSNLLIVRKMRGYRKGQLQAKDKRMQATTECLGNMKVIKLQAWDEMFKARIKQLREVERKWVQKFLNSWAYINVTIWTGPLLMSTMTFLTMVLLGKPLTTAQIFTALTTFRIIQQPFRFLPEVISNCIQALVSFQRIGAFLMEEEVDEAAVGRAPAKSSFAAVEIENASFAWDKLATALAIKDLTLTVKKGTCVAICGTVGSGKSSLLYSIVGELPRLSGTAQVSGRVAYVAQTAWILNDSIQENILFGQPMDPKRYKEAIRTCGLQTDLAQLPEGDETEIGERGTNLSGGQKQRVQLARAVYQDADLYLLDDPFSAVDAHTGTFLFDECVKGALRDKTVIFVTHQVQFLPATDLIIVMKAPGEIAQLGTYRELMREGKDFGSLLDALESSLQSVSEGSQVKFDENPETAPERKLSESPTSERLSRKESQDTTKLSAPGYSKAKLIQEELRETGRVDSRVFWTYLTKFRGGFFVILILISLAFTTVFQISSDAWLGQGTSSGTGGVTGARLMGVYVLLVVGFSLAVFSSRRLVAYVGVATAQVFFSGLLDSVIRAPTSFIDSTPTGRILSRSSTDQSALDMELPVNFVQVGNQMFALFGSIFITVYATPLILFLIIPLAGIYVYLQRYYLNSARELSRLTAMAEAPVFLHISESIAGATTVRAFQQQDRFLRKNAELLEVYQKASFHNLAATEWLGLRLDSLAATVVSAAAILLITLPEGTIDPTLAGMSLSYGLTLSVVLMRLVVTSSQTENCMVSVERLSQYSNVPSEAPAVIPDSRPPSGWPSAGKIELQNLKVRYRPDAPLVMKGISFVVNAQEKVGVVGRTGSGKSTLIQALFRLIEPASGRILIDGIDITTIGLHDLRSALGVIPQEPTLFQGTVRSNLDPFNLCSDEQIWESLEKCQLGWKIRGKPEKLFASVSEQGENWSVGQRQLLCLGRALLRHSRILVLDEATASVDITTDAVIQNTIRKYFAECTVISVAHRIPTVIDSDRVLVLDAGVLKENDSPQHLLSNENSMFSKLVQEYTQRTWSDDPNLVDMSD